VDDQINSGSILQTEVSDDQINVSIAEYFGCSSETMRGQDMKA
jgi:hypothetical protein